jgi:regulator of replication initiation timing
MDAVGVPLAAAPHHHHHTHTQPQHGVAVARPVEAASPLPSPTLAAPLDFDNDMLDTLPDMETDLMLVDDDLAAVAAKKSKPWTPPISAPSSPEQPTADAADAAASKPPPPPPQVGLAAYSADELNKKRETRLARNRQSAQELRKRKRQYTEQIAQQCENLKSQSSQLHARVSALTAENNLLRQENDFYRGMLQRRSTATAPSTAASVHTPPSGPAKSGKAARGVGVLASLLAMIGMTAITQGPVPSSLGATGEVAGGLAPLTARRAMQGEEEDLDERLALPDEELVAQHTSSSHATAVASDVGLVLKDAASPLLPSSAATLQLGTRRFILAAADNAVRWVSTPLGGVGGMGGPAPAAASSSSESALLDLAIPIVVEEQDDYILGGPSRKLQVTVTPQTQEVPEDEQQAKTDTAVALPWTEDDTTEFLRRMLASMEASEKQQVINMLVHEYGTDAFGKLLEHAMATEPGTPPVTPGVDPNVEGVGLSCECDMQETQPAAAAAAAAIVPVAAVSLEQASG